MSVHNSFSLSLLPPHPFSSPVWVSSSMGCSPSGKQLLQCGSCRLQLLQSTSACCSVGPCSAMLLQGLQRNVSPFPKCVFPEVPSVLLKGSAVPCSPGLPSQTHYRTKPNKAPNSRGSWDVGVLSFGREKKSFWICLKMNTEV